jgi:hypothetical protein
MKGIQMSIVIYAIECVNNGLTYVGRSSDHRKRWRLHRRMMKSGVHSIPQMVADWRKFGEDGFAVRVLEALAYDVKPHVAKAAESRWQMHFAKLGRLYNLPRCSMCLRPYDLDSVDIADIGSPGEATSEGEVARRVRRLRLVNAVRDEGIDDDLARIRNSASTGEPSACPGEVGTGSPIRTCAKQEATAISDRGAASVRFSSIGNGCSALHALEQDGTNDE